MTSISVSLSASTISRNTLSTAVFTQISVVGQAGGILPADPNQHPPLTYNETSSEHIYRKQPEAERNFIRGTNSEGLNELFATGDIVNVVLQRFFADVNIYDNSINLFGALLHQSFIFYQRRFFFISITSWILWTWKETSASN